MKREQGLAREHKRGSLLPALWFIISVSRAPPPLRLFERALCPSNKTHFVARASWNGFLLLATQGPSVRHTDGCSASTLMPSGQRDRGVLLGLGTTRRRARAWQLPAPSGLRREAPDQHQGAVSETVQGAGVQVSVRRCTHLWGTKQESHRRRLSRAPPCCARGLPPWQTRTSETARRATAETDKRV